MIINSYIVEKVARQERQERLREAEERRRVRLARSTAASRRRNGERPRSLGLLGVRWGSVLLVASTLGLILV